MPFLQNAQERSHTLRRIKELGVRIAIDDFGTGYSSLNYLRRFQVDTLKINRSLIRGVETDGNSAAVTAAIAALARGLQVIPLAEGVESAGQRDVLSQRVRSHAGVPVRQAGAGRGVHHRDRLG